MLLDGGGSPVQSSCLDFLLLGGVLTQNLVRNLIVDVVYVLGLVKMTIVWQLILVPLIQLVNCTLAEHPKHRGIHHVELCIWLENLSLSDRDL